MSNHKIKEYYQFKEQNLELITKLKMLDQNETQPDKDRTYLEKLQCMLVEREIKKEGDLTVKKELDVTRSKFIRYSKKISFINEFLHQMLPEEIQKENKEMIKYNQNLTEYHDNYEIAVSPVHKKKSIKIKLNKKSNPNRAFSISTVPSMSAANTTCTNNGNIFTEYQNEEKKRKREYNHK